MDGLDNPTYSSEVPPTTSRGGDDYSTYTSDAPPSYSQGAGASGSGSHAEPGAGQYSSSPPQYGSQPYPQPYQQPPNKQDPSQPPQQQHPQQLGVPYPGPAYGQQPYPQPYQQNQYGPQYGGQYGPPQQQYGGNVTVVHQPVTSGGVVLVGNHPANCVQTYMVMSCLTCLFVNWLFGGIAMIFSGMSMSSRDSHDYDAARKWGRVALWLSIAGWIVTGILVMVLIIIIAIN